VAPTEARTNILRLLELVENDPEWQVERGELLRQLGRFDEAVAVLKAVKLDGHSEVKASKIQRLAQAGHTKLASL
jgi:Flp pilus assembly protein TadD